MWLNNQTIIEKVQLKTKNMKHINALVNKRLYGMFMDEQ